MQTSQVHLSDGRVLPFERRTYPIPAETWPPFLKFWQTEWPRTDVEWLEAMRGAYADTLTIEMASTSLGDEVVGTASVYYPTVDPEICCVADVVTCPKMRGLGIAAKLTATVVEAAFARGCRIAYLGNKPKPPSVYEKIGFRRLRGAVMRRAAEGAENSEAGWYATGQAVSVREAVWGDLPGLACLLAQPLDCWFTDFPRGLVSMKHVIPHRCVSNFTTIWNEVAQRGGKMLTLAGESPSRVLGFGTITPDPGPARSHQAVIEATAHDHYQNTMGLLIERLMDEAQRLNLQYLYAYVAERDATKLEHLRKAGFQPAAKLKDHIHLDHVAMDVTVLAATVRK